MAKSITVNRQKKLNHIHIGTDLDFPFVVFLFLFLQSASSQSQQENFGWWDAALRSSTESRKGLIFYPAMNLCRYVNLQYINKEMSIRRWVRQRDTGMSTKLLRVLFEYFSHSFRGENRYIFLAWISKERSAYESSDWGIVPCANIFPSPPLKLKLNQVRF